MADNTTFNAGSGGDTYRSEDRGGLGVKYPIGLIDVGGTDGPEAILGDSGVALPIRGLAAHDAAVSGNPILVGAEFDDSSVDSVDEGDIGRLRISANRNLYVTLRDAAGNERGLNVDGSGNITVNVTGTVTVGSHAVTNAGTFAVQAAQSGSWTVDTELPAAAVLADDVSNPTVPGVAAFGMVYDGSTWDRLKGNATDGMLVNLGANNDVTIGAALPAGGNTIGDVTLSGNALTSLQLIDDPVKTDDAAFSPASDKVMMFGATFDDVASDTVDEGDAGALRMSTRRELYVQLRDAAGNERGLNINASGQISVFNSGTFAVQAVCTNAGTFAVQESGAALTALQLIDDTVFTDDAAYTVGTSKLLGVGMFVDDTSPDTADEHDIAIPRITASRQQIVVIQPFTKGGCSVFRTLDLDETEEDVKTSAGQVYGYYVANLSASTRYLKWYNATAANVSVGTTVPVITMPIPAGAAGHYPFPIGIEFDTAICVACTTGLADNDTGAPAANDLVLNVYYK